MPDDAGRMPPVRKRPAEFAEDVGREPGPAPERWDEPNRPDAWRVAPDPVRERRPAEPPAPENRDAADRPAAPTQTHGSKRRRWIIASVVLLLLLAGAAYFGRYWYTTLRWLETTDDAYTAADMTVIAPQVAGYVDKLLVTDNEHVRAGQLLMSIVPLGSRIYVVANFKETQIARMFRGEQVDITVDAFPGVRLRGTVESLAPGSGAQFALLPPENATGNFTKIVQRVPVRIELHDDGSPVFSQLRPGLSVTATVDTRTAPPAGASSLVPTTGGE